MKKRPMRRQILKNKLKKRFFFNMDKKFLNYFDGRLKQVFMYIIDNCNLNCKQCLYKPNVTYQMGKGEIDYKTALALITDFRKLGASKLTFIGGEPSLYGKKENNKPLTNLISAAKKMGYEYVRLDSNGQFSEKFLNNPGVKRLDEISFSLDGPTPEINDYLRGKGAFRKTVKNIKTAVKLGYRVDITTCVQRKLAEKDRNGNFLLHSMIKFAESLGARQINFHVLLKHGFPMDTWTEQTDIPWNLWIKIRDNIQKKINENEYKIAVRLPKHFVTKQEFNRNKKYYGYCPVKLGERILVHPNGALRICSGLISSQYCVARYHNNKIEWENSGLNEISDHKLKEYTPCTNQSKKMKCGKMLPLCFSFKANQKEIVWKNKLCWDKLNKNEKCI
jgi:MoaA/NifB/PqqE/SkfB family radical SAM enzyme